MSNLVYWIWYASLVNLRVSMRSKVLEYFGDPKEIFYAKKEDFKGLDGILVKEVESLMNKNIGLAEKIAGKCAKDNIRVMTIQDAAYPERLKYISAPPYALYIKGSLPEIDLEPVVAVVGTRSATSYGEKVSRDIGYSIASCGGIVATGLAGGCDSRAAEGALMANGKVIGVLGTAIDVVYPKWNTRLFEDVMMRGALVSEYPPGAETRRHNFSDRNRIIAGLSVATVVTEAPLKSGALITANYALDYGRDVYAVPANVDTYGGRGSNNLLREGARLAENGWDVLRYYENEFPEKLSMGGSGKVPEERSVPKPDEENDDKPKKLKESIFRFFGKKQEEPEVPSEQLQKQLENLTETQLKIVSVMSHTAMHVDDIAELSGIALTAVLTELTLMQVKGYVVQEGGKRFSLNISKRG